MPSRKPTICASVSAPQRCMKPTINVSCSFVYPEHSLAMPSIMGKNKCRMSGARPSLVPWITTRRRSFGSGARSTNPARSKRSTTPVMAPVLRPVISARCPAVIGPVSLQIRSAHLWSEGFKPRRSAIAVWNTTVRVLMRRASWITAPINCSRSGVTFFTPRARNSFRSVLDIASLIRLALEYLSY